MATTDSRLAAAILACALVLAGCGGTDAGGDTSTSTTSTAPAPSTTSVEPTTSASTSSSAAPVTTATTSTPPTTAPPAPTTSTVVSGPEIVTIAVSIADGEISGPGRVTVPFGAQIQLTVTADETDEVHFHGYDVFADVAPGAPARMILIADIPGVFEVELEGRGVELVIVEVK